MQLELESRRPLGPCTLLSCGRLPLAACTLCYVALLLGCCRVRQAAHWIAAYKKKSEEERH